MIARVARLDGARSAISLSGPSSMAQLVNGLRAILGSVTEKQDDGPLVSYSRG